MDDCWHLLVHEDRKRLCVHPDRSLDEVRSAFDSWAFQAFQEGWVDAGEGSFSSKTEVVARACELTFPGARFDGWELVHSGREIGAVEPLR